MSEKITTGLANLIAETLRTSFLNGVAAVYDGTQPASSELAEVGVLLGYITKDGGAFVAGEATNGLHWDAAVNGACPKPTDEEWAIIPIASGTARYIRLYDNTMTTGASTTALRMDMSCGITSGDALWAPTNYLTEGVKQAAKSFSLKAPLA